MDSLPLDINLHEQADGIRIELRGRMDVITCGKFRDTMIHLTAKSWPNLMLDFADLRYIDSFAMGSLLHWRSKALENGRAIVLANCRGAVKDAIRLVGFHNLFEMR